MNRRVLVIDDNEAIQADFLKILAPDAAVSDDLLAAEAELFGDQPALPERTRFEVVTASQGREGLERARAAAAAGTPFAMAFVDMRMPPGWDGLETIQHLWAELPDLEIVICTAFADYSWEEIFARLGQTDRLLIVKKPFDHVEVLQVASALTHKWNLQQQARRTLADLEELIEERTRDLVRARDALLDLNSELSAARDAAEAANRSKSLFLANVSHELRTPMTAILGYAEELRDLPNQTVPIGDHAEAIDTMARNADHMIGVIGDLLDISRLEANRLDVESIPCQPLHIVADVVELLAPRARRRGTRLEVTYATPVPIRIHSDPLRLRQIVLNLVDNALKFTRDGKVTIAVVLAHDPADGEPRLRIEITDNGVGMDAVTIARLFQPFEQAERATARKFGGTGLGLAISRRLANLLGGDIEVESTPGQGSRFTLEIATGPLAGVALIESPNQLQRESITARPAVPHFETSGLEILLVEDGPDNQRLISHVLRRVGCEVALAENGQEALDAIASAGRTFDLVLMDMQMPVMDGLTATRLLRERGSTLPILALTANAQPIDRDTCLLAGCDAFLTKPINRHALVATIAELTGRKTIPQAPTVPASTNRCRP
ncbi:MAG: response regulator [Planctomycetes bacterium]|nr:response regulator [Planctomycetota bacterium]